jgi:hypothetical protein
MSIPRHAQASLPLAALPAEQRRIGRSALAVTAAVVANAALSLATDQLLHVLGVYPPWGQPMYEPELNLLALAYRVVFGVAAGYLVARLAPHAPVRHAIVLGVVATALSTLGAVVAITQHDLGPAWYPVALAVLSYPTVRLGAAWHERRAQHAQRAERARRA